MQIISPPTPKETFVQEIRDAVADLFDAIFDLAAEDVRDFPEDLERIDNVRLQTHDWIEGNHTLWVDEDDVLFTASVVIDALSVQFGSPDLSQALNAQLAAMVAEVRRQREAATSPALALTVAPGSALLCPAPDAVSFH